MQLMSQAHFFPRVTPPIGPNIVQSLNSKIFYAKPILSFSKCLPLFPDSKPQSKTMSSNGYRTAHSPPLLPYSVFFPANSQFLIPNPSRFRPAPALSYSSMANHKSFFAPSCTIVVKNLTL